MIERVIPATERESAIQSFTRLVKNFLPGRELTVSVEEVKEERSGKQRAALFGCAYKALMEQMGLRGEREKNELHEFLLGEYFGWREKRVFGSTHLFPLRTTTTDEAGKRNVLSVRQQMDFYAWVQQRAAEYGYDVPDPDPEWYRRAEREEEIDQQANRGRNRHD